MKTERTSEWRCLNYGDCRAADEKATIELPVGVPFRCVTCGCEDGALMRAKMGLPVKPILLGSAALIAILGVLTLFKQPEPQGPIKPIPPVKIEPVKPPPTSAGALIDERTGLPRQILARPKSKLHPEWDDQKNSGIGKSRTLRDFERLFVFEEAKEGIRVGNDSSSSVGWIEKVNTIDWPRSLVVEYTSPDNRQPVLFFKERKAAEDLCENPGSRKTMATSYYERIKQVAEEGVIVADDYPVLCIEPRDKIGDLYLLPILEAVTTEIDGYPSRVLKLTAAGRERGKTTLKDTEFVKKAVQDGSKSKKPVPLDIAFVMDMTGTMQPWVDSVLQVMRSVSAKIEKNHPDINLIRMGFWGYQDDPSITGIQFRTRNFVENPTTAPLFIDALGDLKVNRLTTDSYPEDVFSGVLDAVDHHKWRAEATKIVILIGDAPGHVSKEQGGATGMDAPQIRQRANDAGVKIVSVQIKDSSRAAYPKYHPLTENQFKVLASNDNRTPAFFAVDSEAFLQFENDLNGLINELSYQKSLIAPEETNEKGRGADIAVGLLAAAKVDQISEVKNQNGEVEVPRDFTGWVIDRDLVDPSVISLEPKLLVSKNELGTLQQTVSVLLREAKEGAIVGRSFFDSVLASVAKTTSGQESKTLASVIPKFISGLPYKSELMEKNAAWWNSRTAEQQQSFIRSLEAKLSYYRARNEDAAQWKPLNKDDEPGLHVTALPLTQLP